MAAYAYGEWTFTAPTCPDCIRVRTAQGFPPVPEAEWGEQCEACTPLPQQLPGEAAPEPGQVLDFMPMPGMTRPPAVEMSGVEEEGGEGIVAAVEVGVQAASSSAEAAATAADAPTVDPRLVEEDAQMHDAA